MNRRLKQLLLLASLAAFTLKAGADDRWETLRAINWVENPTNHTRAGRFGELGPYQFRSTTWRMHTGKSFQMAVQREAADEVAVKHYEWIKRNLENAGVNPSTFNIAMAWNSGVGNVVNGRSPKVSRNYAQRVVNLVNTMKRRQIEEAVAKVEITPPPAVSIEIPSLEEPSFLVPLVPDAPRFEVAVAEPEPLPVVYTEREAAPAKPIFTISTTATLTPRFTLLTSLTD